MEGCRFHATIAFRPPHDVEYDVLAVDDDGSFQSVPLDVYSPQFDRVFSYSLSYPTPPPTTTTNDDDDDDDDCVYHDDDDDVVLRLRPRNDRHDPNKFVERSLLLALGYIRRTMGGCAFHSRLKRRRRYAISDLAPPSSVGSSSMSLALAIKLRADNDFYSQITNLRERGLDLTPHSLEMLEPFLPCPKDESTGDLIVNKTGMGSSAALVASLVGALLQFFGVVSLPARVDMEDGGGGDETDGSCVDMVRRDGLRIAHNLSQICHCYAQGKVGSGFDISSAVYGTHIYTRFSEAFVDEFLERVESSSRDGKGDDLQLSGELSRRLVALVNSDEWDCTVTPFSLPPGLEVLMADICGGSESPSMARGILEWKKKKRKVGFMDDYYWKDLKRCNKRIVSLLTDQFASQSFHDGLRRDGAEIISIRTAEQWKKPMPSSWHLFEGSSWDVALKLSDLRMAFLECRQNLKGMGNSAGVPVEPDEQTAVANATMALPGVVAAGVPGAGGYDALFVIYVKGPATCGGKSDRVRDQIGNLWRDMSDGSNERVLCPLSVRAAGSGGGLCATKLKW
ncbi:hypothetical protein ACHAXA_009543 [Cyclostephanos tholiformis]|uniref:phosphomevalonate kinase n=1 Tax=Cyclostephanos tholiformis TaxID=382380 RepID=A0ABD3R5R0_9STRA